MALATAEELRRLYWDEGHDLVSLGERYRRSPGTVWGWFRKLGVPTRSIKAAAACKARTVTDAEVDRMVSLYMVGLSSNDVGRELGRRGRLVRGHLEKRGVLRPRKKALRLAVFQGKVRKHALDERFFCEWSSGMAWVLGLVFGDGNVHVREGEQYVVSLAGSEQVVRAASRLVGYDGKPRKMRGVRCWVVPWYSRVMVETLRRYGLEGGAKATTLTWPDVPQRYLSHFVRGLWDSDGCWQRRRSGSLVASYSSASSAFIGALRRVLGAHGWSSKVREHHVSLNGKGFVGYQLRLCVGPSQELADWVYTDSTPAIRCERKHGIAAPEGGAYGP